MLTWMTRYSKKKTRINFIAQQIKCLRKRALSGGLAQPRLLYSMIYASSRLSSSLKQSWNRPSSCSVKRWFQWLSKDRLRAIVKGIWSSSMTLRSSGGLPLLRRRSSMRSRLPGRRTVFSCVTHQKSSSKRTLLTLYTSYLASCGNTQRSLMPSLRVS